MKNLFPGGGLLLLIAVLSGCNAPEPSGNSTEHSKVGAQDPEVDPLTAVVWKSRVVPDIVYHSVDGVDVKLDVWVPDVWLGESPWWKPASGKKPTLLYIHGGGWVEGDRQSRVLKLLPFLVRDWVVVNIDYRLAGTAKAPAAVADCLAEVLVADLPCLRSFVQCAFVVPVTLEEFTRPNY